MYNFDYDYRFPDGFESSSSSAINSMAFIILFSILAIAIVVWIITYVFSSISLYTIAKKRGIENPWLAWIPVGSSYLIGKLADYYDIGDKGKSNNFAIWMLCISAACLVLPFTVILSPLSFFAAIGLSVFEYISFYKFFKHVNPDNAVIITVLSIIFSIALPFILFAHRNKDDIFIPQQPQYAQPNGYNPQYQQPYQQPYQPQQPYQQPQQYQAPPQYQPQPQQYQAPPQPYQPQPQQYQAPAEPQAPVQPNAEPQAPAEPEMPTPAHEAQEQND